jgi:predicted DCC family thiol-disulfide oxidoreductase YuxK
MSSCSLPGSPGVNQESSGKSSPGLLSRIFGIDLRSLALFRVFLGILILCDLFLIRIHDLRAHYTDFGVLPRSAYLEKFVKAWYVSIHMMSGEALVQLGLFLVAGFCAVCLILGFRTRLFTFLSWFLMLSLHCRNPMVLQGGDTLFRMLLFWSMFLPLGARFSVDEARNTSHDPNFQRILSVASAALLFQTCFVYWFTWILKDHAIWREGRAAFYALNIDHFVTPLGKWLLAQPEWLTPLTLGTYWWELIGPCLVFIPIFTAPVRIVVIVLMMSMHFGFGRTLEIGLFQYVSMVSWIPFLPAIFWEWAKVKLSNARRCGLKIYYDGECGFCLKTCLILRSLFLLRETPVNPASQKNSIQKDLEERNSWVVVDHKGQRFFEASALKKVLSCSPILFPLSYVLAIPVFMNLTNFFYRGVANHRSKFSSLTGFIRFESIRLKPRILEHVVAAVFLIYVLGWNLRSTDFRHWSKHMPSSWNGFGRLFRVDQYWNMFSPYPLRDDGWYVISGRLANGKEYSIWTDEEKVSWEKPDLVSAMYPTQRWRKYMMNIWQKKNKGHRLYYGKYLCRNFKREHPELAPLETFRIYYMREDTREKKILKPKPISIWTHRCFERKTIKK